jgi:hypothetical protein
MAAASIPVEVSMCSRVADARVVLALSALVAAGACQTDLNDEGPVDTQPPPSLNRPPVLGRPTVTVSPNTRATLDLLAGASDPDGDALTVTHVALDSIGAIGASVQLRGDQRTVDVTPPINYAGLLFISYFVSDGHGSVSGQASVVLDNAPRALDAQQDVLENNATLVNLKGADANSDPLTFKIETQPKHGTLSGFPPTLLYTPASGFVGDDSFTFSVSDGHLSSPAGTISLHVAPPNRRPSATPQSVTVLEDTTASITLSGTDPDSDPLSFQVQTSPIHGTLSVNGASVTYQPASNYNGPDSFSFVVMDPHLSTSDPATVSITVGPLNDPPVAVALQRSLNEDTPTSLTLQATDADGDTPTFAIQDPPRHGSVTGTPPSVTYTPATDYNGPDSFTFTASDANSTSAPATVSLTVFPMNDPPVALDAAVTTAEDTPVAITLQATDVDSPTLTFSIVSQPSDGTLTGSGASWTYTPAPNVSGVRSFRFRASDNTLSATATITITITPVNDPPVAVDDWVATGSGAPLTISPLANDSDVDGDALSITSTGTPAHGTVDIVGAQLVYTPDADFTGVDSFDYAIADPSSATATATVHVGVGQFPQGAPTETLVALAVNPSDVTSNLNAASLSGDGRYIAFNTRLALVPGDTNGAFDVYVYDRGTRTVSRVSEATDGGQGNGNSFDQRISPDGRYVVFESLASNLVSDDTNQALDVFRHDRLTGETVRVSVTTGGGQASGDSFDPRISDDGNLVAFASSAFDLVAGDANGATDIFVRDIAAATTTRVSVSAIGADADLLSTQPEISGDGRFVAFTSSATNLVAGDTNGVSDIFVRNLVAGTTSRVNVSSTGGQADRASTGPSLSHDGQFVSFLSSATTLVTGAPSATQVYVRDTHALTTTRPLSSSFSLAWARLSGDGRYLAAFSSSPGVTICDRFKPATATPPGSASWVWPSFSSNGRYVVVLTSRGDLVVAPNPL